MPKKKDLADCPGIEKPVASVAPADPIDNRQKTFSIIPKSNFTSSPFFSQNERTEHKKPLFHLRCSNHWILKIP